MNFTTFVAALAALSLSVGLSVLTAIYGWGLTPRSWWWIVGAGVFGQLVASGILKKIIKDAGLR